MKCFYFGCVRESGHYLFDRSLRSIHQLPKDVPWLAGWQIDGGLCPKGDYKNGIAVLHHERGWTALSFWDQSVDKRPASNSNFIFEGTFDFDETLALIREHFPSIISRFKFEIVQAVPA